MGKIFFIILFTIAIIYFSFWFGEQIAASESLHPLIAVAGIFSMALSFYRPKMGLGLMVISTLLLPGFEAGTIHASQYQMERSVRLHPEDFIIVAVFIGWLAQVAITKIIGSRAESDHVPFIKFIYLFMFIMILSTTLGIFAETTNLRRGSLFFLKRTEYFLIFFMTANVIRTPQDFRNFMRLFFAASFIVIGFGVIEVFVLRRALSASTFSDSGANALASFLLILIPMLLHAQTLALRSRKWKWMVYLSICFIVFVYCRSRGAYVAFPMMFGAYVFLSKRFNLILPIIILMAIGFTLLPKEIKTEFTSIQGIIEKKNPAMIARYKRMQPNMSSKQLAAYFAAMRIETSWQARLIGAAIVTDLVKKSPFLGGGMGSVELGFVDNQYALDTASLGFVGTSCFLLLLAQIGIFLHKLWLEISSGNAWASTLTIGLLSGLVGMMVHGLTIANFYTIRTMIPFWFLVGLSVTVFRNRLILKEPMKAWEY